MWHGALVTVAVGEEWHNGCEDCKQIRHHGAGVFDGVWFGRCTG